jgi:hypothetical protein
MHGLKSAILAIFQKRLGWPKNSIRAFEKFFLFWVPMNIQKDWKAKLKSYYYFMFKYSRITVCGDKVST